MWPLPALEAIALRLLSLPKNQRGPFVITDDELVEFLARTRRERLRAAHG